MQNVSARIAWAIRASLLGVAFIAASNATYAAEEECLGSPKASTPAGGHWYYRLDRATKRKCWYLAAGSERSGKAERRRPSSAAASKTTAGTTAPPTSRAPEPPHGFANARAELSAVARTEQTPATPPPPMPQTVTPPRSDTLAIANSGSAFSTPNALIERPADTSANESGAKSGGWLVASRWPEPTSVASSDTIISTNAAPQPLSAASTAPLVKQSAAKAVLQPAQPSVDVKTLLIVLASALALAAILGRVIFYYAGKSSLEQSIKRRTRRALWPDDAIAGANTIRRGFPSPHPHMPVRQSRAADIRAADISDEIEDLLMRVTRRRGA